MSYSLKTCLITLCVGSVLMMVSVVHSQAKPICSDDTIVGRATSKDAADAMKRADEIWAQRAIAKLGTRIIFHDQPRLDCTSNKNGSRHTCTITAKACSDPEFKTLGRRLTCGQSGDCEVCCGAPGDPGYSCRPVCR